MIKISIYIFCYNKLWTIKKIVVSNNVLFKIMSDKIYFKSISFQTYNIYLKIMFLGFTRYPFFLYLYVQFWEAGGGSWAFLEGDGNWAAIRNLQKQLPGAKPYLEGAGAESW